MNRFVDQSAPWALAKAGNEAELDRVLYSAAEAIRIAACLLAPVMPQTAEEIEDQLGLKEWKRDWSQASAWGLLPGGQKIGEPAVLFPKLDLRKAEAAPKKSQPQQQAAPAAKEKPMVTIKDFQQLQFRVATVLTAEAVPGADKLLKLTVDLGEEQRTLIAGIALSYQPEEVVGKQVVVVANLEPATIRGVRSEGMVLAGWVKGDDQSLSLISPEKTLPNGATVS
jgi:methionyl-tRNA synthetase